MCKGKKYFMDSELPTLSEIDYAESCKIFVMYVFAYDFFGVCKFYQFSVPQECDARGAVITCASIQCLYTIPQMTKDDARCF